VATLAGTYEDSDVLTAEYALESYFAHADGSGHVYQLCYNGADADITGLFEHADPAMSFAAGNPTGTFRTYYKSGGKVYQFIRAGADIGVTSGLESFAAGSEIYMLINFLVYRTADKLYLYDDAGVDTDITPPYFAGTSEVLYALFTDGIGHVYGYDASSPPGLTVMG